MNHVVPRSRSWSSGLFIRQRRTCVPLPQLYVYIGFTSSANDLLDGVRRGVRIVVEVGEQTDHETMYVHRGFLFLLTEEMSQNALLVMWVTGYRNHHLSHSDEAPPPRIGDGALLKRNVGPIWEPDDFPEVSLELLLTVLHILLVLVRLAQHVDRGILGVQLHLGCEYVIQHIRRVRTTFANLHTWNSWMIWWLTSLACLPSLRYSIAFSILLAIRK